MRWPKALFAMRMRAYCFSINNHIKHDIESVLLCYRSKSLEYRSVALLLTMAKSVRNLLIASAFAVVIFAVICQAADESPGFFLKVTKNVPRLGRRSQSVNEFENFFLKASKTVPRIGRRDDKVFVAFLRQK